MIREYFIWLLLVFVCILGSCSSGNSPYSFILRGELEGVKYGKVYLYEGFGRDGALDSAEMTNGKFILRCKTAEPGRFTIQINRKRVICFLDGKDMIFKGDYNSLKENNIEGSLANDLDLEYTQLVKKEFHDKRNPLLEEYRRTQEVGDRKLGDDVMTRILLMDRERYELTKEFIRKHPDNVYAAYVSTLVTGDIYEQAKELYELLQPTVRQSSWGQALKNEWMSWPGLL